MTGRVTRFLCFALLGLVAGCVPKSATVAPAPSRAGGGTTLDSAEPRAEALVEMVAAQRPEVVAAIVEAVIRDTPYTRVDAPNEPAFVAVEPFRPPGTGRGGTRVRAVQRRPIGSRQPSPTPYDVLAEVGRRLAETDRPNTLFVPRWTDASTEREVCRMRRADVFALTSRAGGSTDTPVDAPEQLPEIVGGMQALAAEIVYPEVDRRIGVEGRVYVQFVVDPEGVPECIVAMAAPSGSTAEAGMAAVRAVRFTPGVQRGRAVRVRFTLPINFVLN